MGEAVGIAAVRSGRQQQPGRPARQLLGEHVELAAPDLVDVRCGRALVRLVDLDQVPVSRQQVGQDIVLIGEVERLDDLVVLLPWAAAELPARLRRPHYQEALVGAVQQLVLPLDDDRGRGDDQRSVGHPTLFFARRLRDCQRASQTSVGIALPAPHQMGERINVFAHVHRGDQLLLGVHATPTRCPSKRLLALFRPCRILGSWTEGMRSAPHRAASPARPAPGTLPGSDQDVVPGADGGGGRQSHPGGRQA